MKFDKDEDISTLDFVRLQGKIVDYHKEFMKCTDIDQIAFIKVSQL